MGIKKRFQIRKQQRWKRRMVRRKLAGHEKEAEPKKEEPQANDEVRENPVSGEQGKPVAQSDS